MQIVVKGSPSGEPETCPRGNNSGAPHMLGWVVNAPWEAVEKRQPRREQHASYSAAAIPRFTSMLIWLRLETPHDPLPSFSPTPPLLVLHWCCIDSSLLTLLICAGLLSHKYFKSVFSGFWKQPVSRTPVSSCAVQALRCAAFVALTSYMTG